MSMEDSKHSSCRGRSPRHASGKGTQLPAFLRNPVDSMLLFQVPGALRRTQMNNSLRAVSVMAETAGCLMRRSEEMA